MMAIRAIMNFYTQQHHNRYKTVYFRKLQQLTNHKDRHHWIISFVDKTNNNGYKYNW